MSGFGFQLGFVSEGEIGLSLLLSRDDFGNFMGRPAGCDEAGMVGVDGFGFGRSLCVLGPSSRGTGGKKQTGGEEGDEFRHRNGNGLEELDGSATIQLHPFRVHPMRMLTRLLLGVCLVLGCVDTAWAQKKKGKIVIEAPELPPVPDMPDAFPQVMGTQIIRPAYKFTKEDGVLEGAREISKMGSRILKVEMPSAPVFTQLVNMPFTHYLLWFRSNGSWAKEWNAEARRREYNATYAFTKDLLTRRDSTGKTFFIGHWEGDWYLLPDKDPQKTASPEAIAAMIDWLNVRQEAVDDARREVPYTRCRVYTYAEVNLVRDAMKGGKQRMVNTVLPKANVDFVSYSAYDVQQLSSEEIQKTLDYVNQQLPARPGLPSRRVFIGECGLSAQACGNDPKVHEMKNREIFTKFLSWKPPLVLYWQFYNNEVNDGKQAGFWLVDDKNKKTPLYDTLHDLFAQQEEAAKEVRQRNRRLPFFDEMATFSENWMNQRGH